MNETTFEKAVPGDFVFDIGQGEGEVCWKGERGLTVKFPNGYRYSYDLTGVSDREKYRTLFWSPVHITPPPRPKRMVKRTVERWGLFNSNGRYFQCYDKKRDADQAAEYTKYPGGLFVVNLTGEYEVEE